MGNISKPHYILGLDLSQDNTGIAVLNIKNKKPKIEYIGNISMKSTYTVQQKLNIISSTIRIMLCKYQPLHSKVYIEDIHVSFIKAVKALARVQGIVFQELVGYDIELMHPTTLKKRITGDGKASKEEVMNGISKLMNVEKDIFLIGDGKYSDDQSDALSLAYIGYEDLCNTNKSK